LGLVDPPHKPGGGLKPGIQKHPAIVAKIAVPFGEMIAGVMRMGVACRLKCGESGDEMVKISSGETDDRAACALESKPRSAGA